MDQLHILQIIGLTLRVANGYLSLNPLIDKTQNSICGTVVKNETVNIRIRMTIVGFENEMFMQCSAI